MACDEKYKKHICEEFEAFENLPPELRKIIRDHDRGVSCVSVYNRYIELSEIPFFDPLDINQYFDILGRV